MCWRRSLLLHLGRQNVRVKLCPRCPSRRRDLAGHYDPKGELHTCASRDGHQQTSTNQYPRKAHRRQKCATVLNISGTAQPSVARSVTESSALSATTAAKSPSVQRSALTASCVARKMTVDGYVGFKQPDNGQGGRPAGIRRRLALPSEEVVQ
jgi:hypothetical protein